MKFFHTQSEIRQRLLKEIMGQIKSTIYAHGPINFKSNSINSTRKRVAGPLKSYYIIRKPSHILKEWLFCSNKKISQDCKANRKWRKEQKEKQMLN